MRPVNKGKSPIKGEFKHYTHAMPYLIKRLGNYCSYCERRFSVGLAVEHVSPKDLHPEEEKKWSNFLIACVQCNSSKGVTDIATNQLGDYVWPDMDDTYHMITYLPEDGYEARAAKNLSEGDTNRVNNTLRLVKVNAITTKYGMTNYMNKLGERAKTATQCTRLKAILLKKVAKLQSKPNDEEIKEEYNDLVDTIYMAMETGGFWSIWMNYFEDIPEIKAKMLDFYNTQKQYF